MVRLKEARRCYKREYPATEFLFEVKPALLDVSFDKPLTAAEAAYERLFDALMGS